MKEHGISNREVEVPPALSVVVLPETSVARERAVGFCEKFSSQSPASQRPVIHWCSFEELAVSPVAEKTMKQAVEAEVVAFAFHPRGELPVPVKLWSENWLNRRAGRSGLLVGLVLEDGTQLQSVASLKEIYLRQLAHRAGLDYLSHFPTGTIRTLPDSLDSFTQRAERITPLLAGILQSRPATYIPPLK